MHKAGGILVLLLICFPVLLLAQEEDEYLSNEPVSDYNDGAFAEAEIEDEYQNEPDWGYYYDNTFSQWEDEYPSDEPAFDYNDNTFAEAEIEDEYPDEPGWDYYYDDTFTRGDQTFIITLGTVLPTIFLNDGKKLEHKITPPVGGTGSLSYNYYLTNHIFVGVEVMGMFLRTISENMLTIIPLGIRAGYQFNVWRLEFPVSIGVGMVWHNYLESRYYGLYAKGGASAFFRATLSWSFGINTDWYWLPQWTDVKSKNVNGNVLNITLSARYHF